MTKRRIIVDCDVGTDDAWALLVLLHAQKIGEIKIEAIACTSGNTTLENVGKNVVRLLEVTGNTNIPVYKGAFEELIKSKQKIILHYHGVDGFGDLEYEDEPNLSLIKEEPASIAIRNIIVQNSLQITLVCLGPLTTVALAAKLYQDFLPNVRDIFIMGGNYTGVGNISATAEFNFYQDPEAAAIILNCAECPITILPIETCYIPEITFEWRLNVLGKIKSSLVDLLNRAEMKALERRQKTARSHLWCPCDAFLVVAMLYPEQAVEKNSSHNVSIELHGWETRGQVVIDHLKQKQVNATIIEKVNEQFFMDTVIAAMT